MAQSLYVSISVCVCVLLLVIGYVSGGTNVSQFFHFACVCFSIVIGFGSMIIKYPEKLEECIKTAAKLANRRVLVQSGWTKLDVEDETGLCHNVGPCPHDWLLPQCCAVVHHGEK
jgi:hypothetical protein